MRRILRITMILVCSCFAPALVYAQDEQTLTIGNGHPSHAGWCHTAGNGWHSNVTYVDLVHPATSDGTLTTASFAFPIWGSRCRNAAKIKFFRRNAGMLTLIAERGPFDGPARDVALSPPVEVRAGDLIGVVKLPRRVEPDIECGGYFEIRPVDQGQYLTYDSDVTGSVHIGEGKIATGTLVVSAAAEARTTEGCSLQTFTGIYAFQEKGSSALLGAVSEEYPGHWAGAVAPFVTVGEVTMGPAGVGTGVFWIRVGSLYGGDVAVPVVVKIEEMNADCTGRFRATFDLGGVLETIVERFVLFDSGREFRAVPIEGGPISLAWIMEGHRIGKSDETPCGPQTAAGRYVWTIENFVRAGPEYPVFSDAQVLRIDVGRNGELTGVLFDKLGPLGASESEVSGAITVDPDCTFAANLTVGGAPVPIRGVFFDQGRRAFLLKVGLGDAGTVYSSGQAQRIGP